MDIIKELLGRLHPLIVHLPIGFIIAGLLLQFLDRKPKEFTRVICIIYLWGGYFAVAACITGYLQYLGEGYSFDTVKIHLWSGIATALLCFVLWVKLRRLSYISFFTKVPAYVLSGFIFIMISFTGHQGGNITHGEDYLIAPLPNALKSAFGYEVFEDKNIELTDENWESTNLYTEVIQPILNNNCVSCHNPNKKKGELLLTSVDNILKGGEHGDVVIQSQPTKSELFVRMKLPKEDDQHMPPDGKSQPSKEAIQLIGIWIEEGLPINKTIGELRLEKELFHSFFPTIENTDYPDIEIAEASIDSITAIKNMGLHVESISKNTNFLTISALNLPSFTDLEVKSLRSIGSQIAILDLGGTQITDDVFKVLADLPHLMILKLDNTEINGSQITELKKLEHLKTLNLSYTNFEKEHLINLAKLKSLEKVFLFKSNIIKTGNEFMNDGKIKIEYGNYTLPPIESDHVVY